MPVSKHRKRSQSGPTVPDDLPARFYRPEPEGPTQAALSGYYADLTEWLRTELRVPKTETHSRALGIMHEIGADPATWYRVANRA